MPPGINWPRPYYTRGYSGRGYILACYTGLGIAPVRQMLCLEAIYECKIGAHEKHLLPLRIGCNYCSHNNLETLRDIVLLGFNVSNKGPSTKCVTLEGGPRRCDSL